MVTVLKKVEQGDIYFLYRQKMSVDRPKNLDDIQRMHMVLVPDKHNKKRLFVIGKKRLPKIKKGTTRSDEREWALNVMTSTKGAKIGKELLPAEYTTETRGKQRQKVSVPAAQGRYQIFFHDDHTELAYKVTEPERRGKALRELGIRKEASYVLSVKNPDIKVPGFSSKKADYPKYLQKKFADKRWIDVTDSRLMDYEETQLLLIGAHKNLDELNVRITGKPDLFTQLGLSRKQWPTKTLETGRFTSPDESLQPRKPRSSRTKGGKRGGRAALKAPSAASIAQTLKGIDLPRDKEGILDYAKSQTDNQRIISVMDDLPDRQFSTMVDVEQALGEVR